MARRASRKAALQHPVEGRGAQTRDKGFARWQRRVMTTLTLMGAFGAFAVLSGLLIILLVLCAQLTQAQASLPK